jgi:hypothetical protein
MGIIPMGFVAVEMREIAMLDREEGHHEIKHKKSNQRQDH